MSEKTCGTCRFRGEHIHREDWPDDGPPSLTPTQYFLCGLIKHLGSMREHESPPMWGHDGEPEGGTPAVTVDGSGYFAALCVADDFGCNRWESPPPAAERKT